MTQSDKQRIIAALQEAVPDVVTSADCSSCSVALVPDDSAGYAYFHSQDCERAFKRARLVAPLYIGFGTPSGKGALAVGRKINKALKAAGFGIDWDGTSAHRIQITSVTTTLTRDLHASQ